MSEMVTDVGRVVKRLMGDEVGVVGGVGQAYLVLPRSTARSVQ